MSSPASFDRKSFAIGVLSTLVVILSMGAADDVFNPGEVERLKRLASYVTNEGDLNIGPRKIIMLGSRIYDDGSQGGGLIIQGGANRIQFANDTLFHAGLHFTRNTLDMPNLNLGRNRIIMQGSSIYDDGSEGGGLILRGGANRLHFHGHSHLYDGVWFKQDTVSINANLDMGTRKIVMQGSSLYDDGSLGGGLILKGGAGNIHTFGRMVAH